MAEPQFPKDLRPYGLEPGDQVITIERETAGCAFVIPPEHLAEGEHRLQMLCGIIGPTCQHGVRRWIAKEEP